MKKLISAVLAAALIVAIGGCAKPQAQSGEGEAFEEDEIVPISIKDDFDAEQAAGVEYAFMGEAGHCEPLYAAGFEHGKYARGAAVGEDKACGGA